MTPVVRRAGIRSRPVGVRLLAGTLLVQGLSALLGGGALVFEPSGAWLGMTTQVLQGTPFADFLVPGLILALALGVAPLATLLGLVRGAPTSAPTTLDLRLGIRAWYPASVAIGVGLVIWILVQVAMIGLVSPAQPLFLAVGAAIVAIARRPSVRRDAHVIGSWNDAARPAPARATAGRRRAR